VPSRFNLKDHGVLTPVKNQRDTGSCTAYSVLAATELLPFVPGISQNESERFLYYMTRTGIDGQAHPPRDRGSWVSSTIKALFKFGSVWESKWPGMHSGIEAEKPPDNILQWGTHMQLLYAYKVSDDSRTVRAALGLYKHPVSGAFRVYENIRHPDVRKTGHIPMPAGKEIGGHAICFVGYDDYKQVLIFKNSWHESWGDGEYGYLPYDFPIQDCWMPWSQEYHPYGVDSAGTG
jgi:C1A family cysteine protease